MYVRSGLLGIQGSSTCAFRKLGTEQRECVTFHLSSASDLFREKAHCGTLLPSLPQQGPPGEAVLRTVLQGKSGLASAGFTRGVILGVFEAGYAV